MSYFDAMEFVEKAHKVKVIILYQSIYYYHDVPLSLHCWKMGLGFNLFKSSYSIVADTYFFS